MADPLSIASGVAGLISLGLQITDSLIQFYIAYKNQDAQIARLLDKLQGLLDLLRLLQGSLKDRPLRRDDQEILHSIDNIVGQCTELIEELQEESKKFQSQSSEGFRTKITTLGHRAAYPFRKSVLQKLDEDVSDLRDNLALAVDVLQVRNQVQIQDDQLDLKDILESIHAAQISTEIRQWLKAPDATIDYNAASAKHLAGTGLWLIQSQRFHRWLSQDNSFLWIHGFAGSGKTILSSSAIQQVLRQKASHPDIGIAFFYFSFGDISKQDESAMLRALLLQLASQRRDGHFDLSTLHVRYSPGTPPASLMIEYLHRMITRFRDVYIIMDALDESPRYVGRPAVLDAVTTFRSWSLRGLHLLVTSRDEIDIRQWLNPAEDQQVAMSDPAVQQDISRYITNQLNYIPSLRKWLPHHDRIQQALAERAQGVFRWVECQLESLKRCPHSERHLEQRLVSLPPTLDKTYERILCSIDEECAEDARRLLALVTFSPRPLTVAELIDAMAVDLGDPPHMDPGRRLQDAEDLDLICPGLIRTTAIEDGWREQQFVHMAHFSVQEYLKSDRIAASKASRFSLGGAHAHEEITRVYLVYLLQGNHGEDESHDELDDLEEEFEESDEESDEPENDNLLLTKTHKLNAKELSNNCPLMSTAATHWHHHYENSTEKTSQLEALLWKLFIDNPESFSRWCRLFQRHGSRAAPGEYRVMKMGPLGSQLYYAILFKLDNITQELIHRKNKQAMDLKQRNCVDEEWGDFLAIAAWVNNLNALIVLLGVGVDVNMPMSENDGTALLAAAKQGHEEAVQLLLDRGADVAASFHAPVLCAASDGGHLQVVKILLSAGAEVNTPDTRLGADGRMALHAAVEAHHIEVAKSLLAAGADVNAQHYRGTPLQMSCWGDQEMMRLLLAAGADVNACVGLRGTVLRAACVQRRPEIVQMLLDHGAEVNASGDESGSALIAACDQGSLLIVRMLLEHGADVNASSDDFGTALMAACCQKSSGIVQLLLDHGADVNASCGRYRTALQMVCDRGYSEMVQLLLDHGADTTTAGGKYSNALQVASENKERRKAKKKAMFTVSFGDS